MANVIGPDVSFYQDDPETPQGIDFVKMRASAGYVIIRAGQNVWVDSDFKINWREAKLAGLPRGSYWFYDSRIEPKRQAELWAQQFVGDFGELPLFADFEEAYKGPYAGWKNWYTFLERLKQLVNGKEIAIYTAYYYWRDNAPNATTQASNLAYFHQYPLWIANYSTSEPLVPLPWKKGEWLFWQYTETGDGKLFGVESNGIDLNYFNGDLAALRTRFNLTDTPPPPPPDPEPIPDGDAQTGRMYRVTASPSLKVREGPGTTYDSIGLLYSNEIVEEINSNTDKTWLKVRKSDGSLIGWSFATYLELKQTTPPVEKRMYKVTASPSLVVRQGPGLNYAKLGSVTRNEIVEEVGANADRTWLKIKNSTGRLIGWSSSAYLQLISETPPTDPPPVEKRMYKVTASPSLVIRQGTGLNYTRLGSVAFNEIVEEVGANADRTWLKIKNSAGTLAGWSSSEYLEYTGTTPLPPPVDKMLYRVIRTSTQMLEEALPTAKLVGLIYYGEIVEEVSANADRSWLKIKKSDGSLSGWSLSKDLLTASIEPPPIPEEPPISAPQDADKKWYRVNYASLTVREAPNVTGKVSGTVFQDDTLPALDDTTNPDWAQIRRVDGLTGWCEKKYLVFLSNSRPASIRQNLFKGVSYLQKDLTIPRKNRMHVLAIDLNTVGLEFLVTPSKISSGLLCTRTTSKFLEEFSMNVAINGDGFSYLDASVSPISVCPSGGDPVKANGFAASRGTVYSPIKTVQPTVYISSTNELTVDQAPSKVFNAVSGDRVVVEKGVTVKNLAAATPSPRTAVGLNRSGRWLIFMVVDGRQAGYSEGVTFPELADLMISYGVYTGVNMDGGGSSTMIIRGVDGKARLLNSPIDQNTPGKQRSVANHLGLYIKK